MVKVGILKKPRYYFILKIIGNIASPVIIEDKTIKFIDYDLDLRIFPDNTYKVLDESEYEYHKKIMKYSLDLQKIIEFKLNELIKRFKCKSFPFDKKTIRKYEREYNFLKKNNYK